LKAGVEGALRTIRCRWVRAEPAGLAAGTAGVHRLSPADSTVPEHPVNLLRVFLTTGSSSATAPERFDDFAELLEVQPGEPGGRCWPSKVIVPARCEEVPVSLPVVHPLPTQVREFILEGIVSGRWKPGERIVERRIAAELQVSQTPIREALRELEALRLIESSPNKGVRVRPLSKTDLQEIYPVRAGLERVAASIAAPRLATGSVVLETAVTALREADRLGDSAAQVRHTVAFHRELVRAAGNEVLLHTWESLGVEVWTTLAIRWLGASHRSYADEHQAVLDAFRARAPGVAELVEQHVLGCAPQV
jgi:DNA-binding GntR family transcriptional regulator